MKKLFGGFKGYLQSDASNVYDILERGPPDDIERDDSVKLVGCWAHCQRYFFEAAICRYPVGLQGLMRMRAIYAIDDSFRKLPPVKRKTMRDEHVRPLMDGFFQWAKDARAEAQGRNLATKALGYALNQEAELRRVLADARLPLDNTRSERSLRKIVVGRKNWMFYGSDSHAESAAAIFTIIATCRLQSIDPEQYLDEVLRVLPSWPRERYLELAPNNWAATRGKLDPDELDAPFARSLSRQHKPTPAASSCVHGFQDGVDAALTLSRSSLAVARLEITPASLMGHGATDPPVRTRLPERIRSDVLPQLAKALGVRVEGILGDAHRAAPPRSRRQASARLRASRLASATSAGLGGKVRRHSHRAAQKGELTPTRVAARSLRHCG